MIKNKLSYEKRRVRFNGEEFYAFLEIRTTYFIGVRVFVTEICLGRNFA